MRDHRTLKLFILFSPCLYDIGLDVRKPLFGVANNKGADQSALSHSPFGTFVIHSLKSIISKLASNEIPIF